VVQYAHGDRTPRGTLANLARRSHMSKSLVAVVLVTCLAFASAAQGAAADPAPASPAPEKVRRLSVKEYVDRMKGAWIGQMAGVGQGAPTEFHWKGYIGPENQMPNWTPGTVNQFNQDDVYVEMTFLRSLEQCGFDVSIRQAGIDFANSSYPLWHANDAGRSNLRRGIAPPDSGHPKFNRHADDIDYQIESDYSGIIAPGMPNIVVELGEKFGRLMNYGDGLYGGQFFGAMYAEAFFETDREKIIEAAVKAIPAESQYAEMVRDMLRWHKENPDDWQKTWDLVEKKYHADAAYTHGLCSAPGRRDAMSIDAKLNGAYVIMGVLYGKGDPDATIRIACRAGQDSDCNPSSAAGVLFTTIGYEKIPGAYKSALNPSAKFSHTPYSFTLLAEVCEKLARQAVVRGGGKIEKTAAGEEVFVIPVVPVKPSALERSWQPGPAADAKFTAEEMAKITVRAAPAGGDGGGGGGGTAADIKQAVEKFAPGWTVKDCGADMNPGFRDEWGGRKNVLVTHPLSRNTGCVLSKTVDVPSGKKTTLHLVVTHDPEGDFDLIVRADGKQLLRKSVDAATADGWLVADIDLAPMAGKSVKLELVNQPSGWHMEAAYWAEIAVRSE